MRKCPRNKQLAMGAFCGWSQERGALEEEDWGIVKHCTEQVGITYFFIFR